jgi:hypothetical protein
MEKVMLTKTMDFAVPEETEAINVIVSNENELRAAINQVGTIATVERPPAIITLASDIELISDFIIPTGVDVTLRSANNNVFSLISTRDMDVITIIEGSKLTIENINISRNPGTRGSGIIAQANTELIMYNGTIRGHVGTESDRSGGIDSYGTFIMNGGTISGNAPGGFWVAGDVHVAGSFTMNSGTIGGDEDGGFSNSGSFTMNDGTLTGKINIPSWGRSRDSSFTVNNGVINGDITSENTGNPMRINGGVINGNVSGGNLGGNIIIDGGIINGNIQMSRITLDSGEINGRVIVYGHSGSSVFTMNGGSVKNSDGNGVSVGRSTLAVSIIMNGGSISGHSGRGVLLNAAGATFTMNGGSITGNSDGGVLVESHWTNPVFEMTGGYINNNNTASGGGGVETSGDFIMTGGEIFGNTAGTNGGGVLQHNGTFTFNGGWIYNNRANNGDDISIGQSGTFNNNVFDNNTGAIGSTPPS